VSPGKQGELLHVILFDQRQHKPDKASNVEAEREESVVCDQNFEEVLKIKHQIIISIGLAM
jgi:hypothetical protein